MLPDPHKFYTQIPDTVEEITQHLLDWVNCFELPKDSGQRELIRRLIGALEFGTETFLYCMHQAFLEVDMATRNAYLNIAGAVNFGGRLQSGQPSDQTLSSIQADLVKTFKLLSDKSTYAERIKADRVLNWFQYEFNPRHERFSLNMISALTAPDKESREARVKNAAKILHNGKQGYQEKLKNPPQEKPKRTRSRLHPTIAPMGSKPDKKTPEVSTHKDTGSSSRQVIPAPSTQPDLLPSDKWVGFFNKQVQETIQSTVRKSESAGPIVSSMQTSNENTASQVTLSPKEKEFLGSLESKTYKSIEKLASKITLTVKKDSKLLDYLDNIRINPKVTMGTITIDEQGLYSGIRIFNLLTSHSSITGAEFKGLVEKYLNFIKQIDPSFTEEATLLKELEQAHFPEQTPSLNNEAGSSASNNGKRKTDVLPDILPDSLKPPPKQSRKLV